MPVYRLPRDIVVLDRFPLNANGKYDRSALQLILEKKFGSDHSRALLPGSAGDAVLNGDPPRRQETSSKLEVLKP
jgi:hypothetical protein